MLILSANAIGSEFLVELGLVQKTSRSVCSVRGFFCLYAPLFPADRFCRRELVAVCVFCATAAVNVMCRQRETIHMSTKREHCTQQQQQRRRVAFYCEVRKQMLCAKVWYAHHSVVKEPCECCTEHQKRVCLVCCFGCCCFFHWKGNSRASKMAPNPSVSLRWG